MAASTLKVSVLANGSVLLEGNPVNLAELEKAMRAGPAGETAVWYYREDAAGEAPPVALDVMRLITECRLPVRLSAKPDFSDTVVPSGSPAWAKTFDAIRQRAGQRQLVILRPDGRQLALPALAKESASAEQTAAVERLLPSSSPRNVVAIADTSWTMAEKPNLRDAAAAVPFFGLLMGFTFIGHLVWMLDANPAAALSDGCRGADVVIVDSARLEKLPPNWQSLIPPEKRTPQILIYDRTTSKLKRYEGG